MRQTVKFFQQFVLGVMLVMSVWLVSEATTRRYSGTEVQNLIDTVNGLSAALVQTQENISTITHKLDQDGGVTDTNYWTSISPITTAENALRR